MWSAFSAGGELAGGAAVEYEAFAAHGPTSARPDFCGLIYPGPTPFESAYSRETFGA